MGNAINGWANPSTQVKVMALYEIPQGINGQCNILKEFMINYNKSKEVFLNRDTYYRKGLIQVDFNDHPPIPLAQRIVFHFGSFSILFRVLNFRGRFEARNNIFWAR